MWVCSLALCVWAARVEAQAVGASESDTRRRAAKDALHYRVRTGITCRQAGDGSTVCDYTVGRSLAFQIRHVGLPDALVLVQRSNEAGDYHAAFIVENQCVVVAPGKAASPEEPYVWVYVSPVTGKVYKEEGECSLAGRSGAGSR